MICLNDMNYIWYFCTSWAIAQRQYVKEKCGGASGSHGKGGAYRRAGEGRSTRGTAAASRRAGRLGATPRTHLRPEGARRGPSQGGPDGCGRGSPGRRTPALEARSSGPGGQALGARPRPASAAAALARVRRR